MAYETTEGSDIEFLKEIHDQLKDPTATVVAIIVKDDPADPETLDIGVISFGRDVSLARQRAILTTALSAVCEQNDPT